MIEEEEESEGASEEKKMKRAPKKSKANEGNLQEALKLAKKYKKDGIVRKGDKFQCTLCGNRAVAVNEKSVKQHIHGQRNKETNEAKLTKHQKNATKAKQQQQLDAKRKEEHQRAQELLDAENKRKSRTVDDATLCGRCQVLKMLWKAGIPL
jgi:6-phosphofructokinase